MGPRTATSEDPRPLDAKLFSTTTAPSKRMRPMRRLRYELLPPIGPGTMPAEGTVVDLLFDIPYLIGWGAPLPSHYQLNSLLRKGYDDAGMSGGCAWEPFELSADEYDEVVSAIKQDE